MVGWSCLPLRLGETTSILGTTVGRGNQANFQLFVCTLIKTGMLGSNLSLLRDEARTHTRAVEKDFLFLLFQGHRSSINDDQRPSNKDSLFFLLLFFSLVF